MTYRDDRNALVDRVAVLEEKLSEARSRAEQADGLRREIEANHRELEALRRKLAPSLPAADRPGPSPRKWGAIAAIGVSVAGGVLAFGVVSVRQKGGDLAENLPECAAYLAAVDRCAATNPTVGKPLQQAASAQRAGWESMHPSPQSIEPIRRACVAATGAVEKACAPTGACGCTVDDLMCKMRCSAGGAATPAPAATPAVALTASLAEGGGDEFNRAAAMSTLSSAANAARGCKKPDGPTGSGRVRVTFGPTGSVQSASVDPPFGGTSVGGCVAGVFRSAHVPPFGGLPVTVSKSFSIQ